MVLPEIICLVLALKKKSATTIYLLTKKNRIKSHILSFENFDLKTPKIN